jgi:hypothetical protein
MAGLQNNQQKETLRALCLGSFAFGPLGSQLATSRDEIKLPFKMIIV